MAELWLTTMTQMLRQHDYLLANYSSLQRAARNLLPCPTPPISAELQPMEPKVVAHQLRMGPLEVVGGGSAAPAVDLR